MSTTSTTTDTVAEAVEKFLHNVEGEYRPSTMLELRRWLPTVTELEVEGVRLAEIPYAELTSKQLRRALLTFKRSLGRPHTGTGKRKLPSAATVSNVFSYVQMWTKERESWYDGLERDDPMASIKRSDIIPRKQRKMVRPRAFLDAEQVEALLEAVNPTYRRITTLIAATGLRSGEARGLHWENVDLEAGLLVVCESASQDGKRIGPTKTPASEGTVALSERALSVLREQFQRSGPSGLVFPTKSGNAISARNLWNAVSKGGEKAGLPKLGPHDLRNTVGQRLLLAGVPLPTVSGILRHGSPLVTAQFYSTNQISDEEKLEAVRRAL